jgi:predicted nucleic acid-binding Zn ribbon protein
MTVRLPPHSHCLECDDPVEEGIEYCSDRCREKSAAKKKKSSTRMWLFYAIAGTALVLFWVIAFVI